MYTILYIIILYDLLHRYYVAAPIR